MSEATTGSTATIERDTFQLTASDRCDSCGAQAYIKATIGDSALLFCAHHGRRHYDKLSAIATDWHDESSRLHEDI